MQEITLIKHERITASINSVFSLLLIVSGVLFSRDSGGLVNYIALPLFFLFFGFLYSIIKSSNKDVVDPNIMINSLHLIGVELVPCWLFTFSFYHIFIGSMGFWYVSYLIIPFQAGAGLGVLYLFKK